MKYDNNGRLNELGFLCELSELTLRPTLTLGPTHFGVRRDRLMTIMSFFQVSYSSTAHVGCSRSFSWNASMPFNFFIVLQITCPL